MSKLPIGQIELNGESYAIEGDVRIFKSSLFAPKMVTGDVTKDSDPHRSVHAWSDFRGGCFLKDMDERTDDIYRSYWSTLNTDHKRNLVLGPLNTATAYSLDNAKPSTLVDGRGTIFATIGARLCSFNYNTNLWLGVSTMESPPSDAINYKDVLFFALGSDILRYDAFDIAGLSDWQYLEASGITTDSANAEYFVIWDGKLYKIDEAGNFAWTDDISTSGNWGENWESAGKLYLPSGACTGLITYLDASGNEIIYAGTKYGLYSYDAANEKFWKTGLNFPKHDYGCKGMAVFRGVLYVSVGMDVHAYDILNRTMPPIGMNYGMTSPINYTGSIVKMASSYNHIYAIVDATVVTAQTLFDVNPFTTAVILDNEGYSFVAKWGGFGWSIVKKGSSTDAPPTVLYISQNNRTYRLFYNIGATIYWQKLENNLINPIEAGDYEHESSGELITPWFDANNDTTDKVLLKVIADTSGCSASEKVAVTYQSNNASDADSWTGLLAITSDGKHSTTLASGAGLENRRLRFKIAEERGSTATATPNLHSFLIEYKKVLDIKYGYMVRVDINKHAGKGSPATRLTDLLTAAATKTLMPFTYNDDTTSTPKYVFIDKMPGEEKDGKYTDGVYDLTLIEG